MKVGKGDFLLRKKKYSDSIWVFICKVTGFTLHDERAVAKVIKKDKGTQYSGFPEVYLSNSSIKRHFHIISKEKALSLIV